MIYEALGAIGNALFAWACITMAVATIRKGADIGTPLTTMWTFLIANASFGAYLFGEFGPHVLFATAVVETICWKIALWYHYFPRVRLVDPQDIINENVREVFLLYADRPILNMEFVSECIREPGHEGPCNGRPSRDCPGYAQYITRPINHS